MKWCRVRLRSYKWEFIYLKIRVRKIKVRIKRVRNLKGNLSKEEKFKNDNLRNGVNGLINLFFV